MKPADVHRLYVARRDMRAHPCGNWRDPKGCQWRRQQYTERVLEPSNTEIEAAGMARELLGKAASLGGSAAQCRTRQAVCALAVAFPEVFADRLAEIGTTPLHLPDPTGERKTASMLATMTAALPRVREERRVQRANHIAWLKSWAAVRAAEDAASDVADEMQAAEDDGDLDALGEVFR